MLLIKKYPHLQGVKITDCDTKHQLPIHVVLGSREYAHVTSDTKPQIGQDGEPAAEKTNLGWFIMSPGSEFDHNTMLLMQTSQSDNEDLCRLDILGLADTPEHDQRLSSAHYDNLLHIRICHANKNDASNENHFSTQKALNLFGICSNSFKLHSNMYSSLGPKKIWQKRLINIR